MTLPVVKGVGEGAKRPRARRGLALATLAALTVAGAAPPALAGEREYGISLGPVTPLVPSNGLGAMVALSASASTGSGRRVMRARGELLGLAGEGGSWAALPTLTGDVGLQAGRLELFLTGGVELFGFARRAGFTAFSTVGLLSGAGLSVRLTPRFRLTVRGLVAWLPSFTAAKISADEGIEKPNFAWLSVLAGLEIGGGSEPEALGWD